MLWLAAPAAAEPLRLATWNPELTRAGPGLLLRDILSGDDPQVTAVVAVIAALDADVLLLTGVDWDHAQVALAALSDRLAAAGAPYPHRLALRPNTGMATGLDLNGDGRTGTPDDAQGWGRFAGSGGMALLSRLPLDAPADLSTLLWRDLPGAIPPPMPPGVAAVQRLPTTGHWIVPVTLPGGTRLTLLAFHAAPPVFDGPEDRNGRRNHDEAALWSRLLDGALPIPAPAPPFAVLGQPNLDPVDGEGRHDALRTLLADPRLQDPAPRGTHGRAQQPGQSGDPAQDTALFPPPGPGGLRLSIVLPSADLTIAASGVLWPADTDPLAATLAQAGRHRPVWVDVSVPQP